MRYHITNRSASGKRHSHRYYREGEVDSCYTFDSKGRIAGFEWEDGREKEMELYTWDDSDRLVEVSRNGTADFNDDGLPDDT
ncbi:MAG: hypothetical protein LBB73_07165, partial [Dysgonamonadaceae bacterium]|nr:hypothetical protein [Dysgonamonadaceae bacterium]